eukprot:gene1903-33317_t
MLKSYSKRQRSQISLCNRSLAPGGFVALVRTQPSWVVRQAPKPLDEKLCRRATASASAVRSPCATGPLPLGHHTRSFIYHLLSGPRIFIVAVADQQPWSAWRYFSSPFFGSCTADKRRKARPEMNFVNSALDKISTTLGVNPSAFNGFLLGGLVVYALLWKAVDDAKKVAAAKVEAAAEADGSAAADTGTHVTNASEATQDATNQVQVDLLWKVAHEQREKMGDDAITLDHMVLALAQNPRFKEILSCTDGLSEEEIKQGIKKSRIMYNRGETKAELIEEVPTALSKYARDLTTLAREGKLDPVIGRSDEIRRLINILSRRTKNNPVIVGESGVGKTALVDGLAQRIASGDVPDTLKDTKIMALDLGIIMAALVYGLAQRIASGDVPDTLKDTKIMALDLGILMAGAMMPGEFEERMKVVLQELTEVDSKFVLFIDDIHSGGGIMDASILLKPLLSRGELRCIGATTQDKFRKFIEKDPGLERRFQQFSLAQCINTELSP